MCRRATPTGCAYPARSAQGLCILMAARTSTARPLAAIRRPAMAERGEEGLEDFLETKIVHGLF